MEVGFWSLHPDWQNFSSMYREADTAIHAGTDMEKSHHLTATLYFGIASLEAFLNKQMRLFLSPVKSADEINQVLRRGRFSDKLVKWPVAITGKSFSVSQEVMELLEVCNDVRGHLTHPKTNGRDVYERLFAVEPLIFVDAVAQYVVSFHKAKEDRYPYWVFGWNYLNPRPEKHEITLINEQQFCHSLATMGYDAPAWDWARGKSWKDRYFVELEGYKAIRDALRSRQDCEPKVARFPHQPKLCRRWWIREHQKTCGHVSAEAMVVALALDRE